MELKLIKKVEILSCSFNVTWDKTHDGGSFSWSESMIIIGIKSYKKDPLYTFSVLNHELMELIYAGMGMRYESPREQAKYRFVFNHQEFENANTVFSQALSKFIK
jgi:hypothetical protein